MWTSKLAFSDVAYAWPQTQIKQGSWPPMWFLPCVYSIHAWGVWMTSTHIWKMSSYIQWIHTLYVCSNVWGWKKTDRFPNASSCVSVWGRPHQTASVLWTYILLRPSPATYWRCLIQNQTVGAHLEHYCQIGLLVALPGLHILFQLRTFRQKMLETKVKQMLNHWTMSIWRFLYRIRPWSTWIKCL